MQKKILVYIGNAKQNFEGQLLKQYDVHFKANVVYVGL